MNVWDQIKQALSVQLSAEGYQNWIHPTTQEMVDGDVLLVRVPNAETAEWIEKEYSDSIWTAVRDFGLPFRRILYHPGNGHQSQNGAGETSRGAEPSLEALFSAPTIHLNSKFTFDTFVVGSCNQFAHAAAKAVATTPSNSYNPLFIYGGVGMGKTHLMHAIGRQLLDNYGSLRLIYTTSEKFMNQMINCIKLDRMSQFHAHYRTADVLMVDDIQILAGKERTQEEFFHTFNELFDHQKQIILSSDSPPKNTPGLVERLRSRFEWGLMVDVQPPDLETKMAILDKKAEAVGVHLPEDVRIFIATKTKSNIRELEGALIKLIAYSSVTGSPISMEMAQHALKHLATGPEKRITIDSIIRAVAERHTLQPSQLKMKSNERKIAYPRQIAMYLTKELTNASLPEIGRAFGGKHHTTVLHSVQKIEALRQRDSELNRSIHSLIDSLNG